jgi:hypothetical protein
MAYIVTKSLKNKGLAVFLVVMFGGLGLFYSSIAGGIVMIVFYPLLIVVLFFSGHFLFSFCLCCIYYLICIIWAIKGINIYNNSVMEYSPQYSQSTQETTENANSPDTYESPYSFYKEKNNSVKWLLITVSILLIAIFGVHYYDTSNINGKTLKLDAIFSSHSEDKEAINNLIEKSYLDLVNGEFTVEGFKKSDHNSLPFYNENVKTLSVMALVPLANLLSNGKSNFQIEPKNIKVIDFGNDNTAKVEYDLNVSTSGDTKTTHVNMIVKKIAGLWKLDANKFLGINKVHE